MADQVERFSHTPEAMLATDNGDWVRYSDYANLAESYELLEAERKDPGSISRGEEFAAGLEAGEAQARKQVLEEVASDAAAGALLRSRILEALAAALHPDQSKGEK